MPKRFAAFAISEDIPETIEDIPETMTMGKLAGKWKSFSEKMSPLQGLTTLKNEMKQNITRRLPDEKCKKKLPPLFDSCFIDGSKNISKSLKEHYMVLNLMLYSVLNMMPRIIENYGKKGQSPKEMHLKSHLINDYGEMDVTIKYGLCGGWRKNELQILLDLQLNQLNEILLPSPLPPLFSELVLSDEIDPLWKIFLSQHGSLKMAWHGDRQRADGVRLTLWCDSKGENIIVGTAHTTLESNTPGQQRQPDPLSRVYRTNLLTVSNEDIESLYSEVDNLLKEIPNSPEEQEDTSLEETQPIEENQKPISLIGFGNSILGMILEHKEIALIAGFIFIWFQR